MKNVSKTSLKTLIGGGVRRSKSLAALPTYYQQIFTMILALLFLGDIVELETNSLTSRFAGARAIKKPIGIIVWSSCRNYLVSTRQSCLKRMIQMVRSTVEKSIDHCARNDSVLTTRLPHLSRVTSDGSLRIDSNALLAS